MKKSNRWFLYAVSAGLLWGVWGVVAKLISENVNPFTNHFLFTAGMLLTLPVVVRKLKRETFNRKGFWWGVAAACFAIAGNVAVFYAFSGGGQASIVIPVTNLYPLVTIIIAILVFKERLNWINVAGILLAVPAILLLSGETLLFTDPALFFSSIGLNGWFLFSLAAIRFCKSAIRFSDCVSVPKISPNCFRFFKTPSKSPGFVMKTAMFCRSSVFVKVSICEAVETNTICGLSAIIVSIFGLIVSPTLGICCASAGKLQNVVTPTRRSPAPTAKTLSVRFGANETARSTRAGILTVLPKSSVISRAGILFCGVGFSL